jgi:hypothetical protein
MIDKNNILMASRQLGKSLFTMGILMNSKNYRRIKSIRKIFNI